MDFNVIIIRSKKVLPPIMVVRLEEYITYKILKISMNVDPSLAIKDCLFVTY